MRKTVLVFACAMLVAGVAGAQGNGQWCPEGTEPCVRILDPLDGETVNPETAFLIEVVLDPPIDPQARCRVHVGVYGQTSSSFYFAELFAQRRPNPRWPTMYFYVGQLFLTNPDVLEVLHPSVDEGEYLPTRFRIFGQLHLAPNESLRVDVRAAGNDCGPTYEGLAEVSIYTSD